MQCQCGNTMLESTHEVKTLKKANEWARDVSEHEMPLKIHQNKCNSCGRLSYLTENNAGFIIRRFN